jgi:glycosyltransferase involved in cell wall biosynthesis
MKILIVSQYFWPEEFRINDLAVDLVGRGNDITVLTGNPNYPKGKFFKGYSFKFMEEEYQGVKIYRVPIIPRGKNRLMLILNYLSFTITGSIFILFHRIKYDKVFAVNFSPITAVIPAVLYKKIHKKQLYLWVQDLWPESVSAAGNINYNFVLNLLTKIVKYIYKNSDRILLQSEGFIKSVQEKGVENKKIDYIPNWAEDLYNDKSKIEIKKYRKIIPKGFIVMFAGNIGEAQDFESILKAALKTKNYSDIKWVIIGDGRRKSWVESEIDRLELNTTFILLGRYPMNEIPSFFVHANVMLLSLKDEGVFNLTIPSKLQSYMAFGKPIIGMLNGNGSDIIKKANCGFVSKAGDYMLLAENVIEAYRIENEELLKIGDNGIYYYNQNFSKKMVVDKLVKILIGQEINKC